MPILCCTANYAEWDEVGVSCSQGVHRIAGDGNGSGIKSAIEHDHDDHHDNDRHHPSRTEQGEGLHSVAAGSGMAECTLPNQ